jgi:hypothetical protein
VLRFSRGFVSLFESQNLINSPLSNSSLAMDCLKRALGDSAPPIAYFVVSAGSPTYPPMNSIAGRINARVASAHVNSIGLN